MSSPAHSATTTDWRWRRRRTPSAWSVPPGGGAEAGALVEDLRRRLPLEVVDLDLAIAREAARLRARHLRLRLPDALVVATALVAGADRLVTTDRRWPDGRALGIPVAVV